VEEVFVVFKGGVGGGTQTNPGLSHIPLRGTECSTLVLFVWRTTSSCIAYVLGMIISDVEVSGVCFTRTTRRGEVVYAES